MQSERKEDVHTMDIVKDVIMFSILFPLICKLWSYTHADGIPCANPEGVGAGFPDPPEKRKNIGLLSNTSPDPLKNHKATKPVFNVGPSSTRQ